ncbi:DNA repair protein [[Haemophilus] felis]|nr:DNA repair protein [[Haemophilus] felis]
MSNAAVLKEFNWVEELEKTVVQSLTTSFGLDFLLLEDKKGGDVNTVHNAREYQKEIKENGSSDIHLSNELKSQLDEKGRNIDPYKKVQYDENGKPKINHKGKEDKKDDYHNKSEQYEERKKKDQNHENNGTMIDGYTDEKIASSDIKKKRNGKEFKYVTELDHVVAASEVHDDLGRILADLDGVSLANSEDNLVSTHWVINNAKNDYSLDDFFKEGGVRDKKIEGFNNDLSKKQNELQSSNLSKEDKVKLEKEILEIERKKEILENLDEEKMKKIEKDARDKYNKKINSAYYSSTKFLKNTGLQAGKKGLQMGTRQALGLVFAELWFELKEQVPNIYQQCKNGFTLEKFFSEIQKLITNIWERLKKRFKDLITAFKDGMLGGVMASLTTTLQNIFLTSTKRVGKMIREMWNSLVGVIKLVFFNPNNLLAGDLLKESLRLLSLGVSALVGTMLNEHLDAYFTAFPLLGESFGKPISAFLSALATGVINLGFVYFLEHSEITQKVWNFLNEFSINSYQVRLDRMKEINAELDRYLVELSKIEFNLNAQELATFSNQLVSTNSELERSIVLNNEIERRNIYTPFDPKNPESQRNWLKSAQKKCRNG